MVFEWDEDKDESNLRKHGISFAHATLAFDDPMRYERPERSLDHGEDRWSLTGVIGQREIVVVFTLRESNTRIISARKATSDERKEYWENRIFHT